MSFEKHYLDEHEKDVEYFVVYGKPRTDGIPAVDVYYDSDYTKPVDVKTLIKDGGRRLVCRMPNLSLTGVGVYGFMDCTFGGTVTITAEGDAVEIYKGEGQITDDADRIDTGKYAFEYNGIDIAYCTIYNDISGEKYTLYRAYDSEGRNPFMTSNPDDPNDPNAVKIIPEHNSYDKLIVPRKFNIPNTTVAYHVWYRDPNKKTLVDDVPCYMVALQGSISTPQSGTAVMVYSAYAVNDDRLVKASLTMDEAGKFLPGYEEGT